MAAFAPPACAASAQRTSASAAARRAVARRAASPRLSRRALGCALASALVRLSAGDAARAADAPPGLPGGAAEFSRVLAARARWDELGMAISNGNVSEDEWKSARSFLRAFYSIGSDMRFLAKPWDKPLRSRGEAAAKDLEKTIKLMDVPAKDADADKFLALHKEAGSHVTDFFEVFTEASAGDMPAEL